MKTIKCNSTLLIEKGYLAVKVDSFMHDEEKKALHLFNGNTLVATLPLDMAELKFIESQAYKDNQIKYYEVVERKDL